MDTQPFRRLPRAAQAFNIVLWIVWWGACAWAFTQARVDVAFGLTIIFALTNLVAPVPIRGGGVSAPNVTIVIVAALIWRPAEVLVGVAVGSLLGQLVFRKRLFWIAMMNAGLWGLPAALATLLAHGVMDQMGPGYPRLILAAGLAVVTYRVSNTALFAAYRSARFGYSFFADWRSRVTAEWDSTLLSGAMPILLAAIASRIASTPGLLALTAVSALTLPSGRAELVYFYRSREIFEQIVASVVGTLEQVLPGATAHSERVHPLATAVATRLRLPERIVRSLSFAAQLHDIGFIGAGSTAAPPMEHAAVGARILSHYPDPGVADLVRTHHDYWDTNLFRHDRRPLAVASRILAVCEVYESARGGLPPFGTPMAHEEAATVTRAQAGAALDPELVPVVLEVAEMLERQPAVACP